MVSSFDRNNIGLSNISAENNDRVNIKAVKVNLYFFFFMLSQPMDWKHTTFGPKP